MHRPCGVGVRDGLDAAGSVTKGLELMNITKILSDPTEEDKPRDTEILCRPLVRENEIGKKKNSRKVLHRTFGFQELKIEILTAAHP